MPSANNGFRGEGGFLKTSNDYDELRSQECVC